MKPFFHFPQSFSISSLYIRLPEWKKLYSFLWKVQHKISAQVGYFDEIGVIQVFNIFQQFLLLQFLRNQFSMRKFNWNIGESQSPDLIVFYSKLRKFHKNHTLCVIKQILWNLLFALCESICIHFFLLLVNRSSVCNQRAFVVHHRRRGPFPMCNLWSGTLKTIKIDFMSFPRVLFFALNNIWAYIFRKFHANLAHLQQYSPQYMRIGST